MRTPHEIIFTSGATEANNLALLGVARAALRAGTGAATSCSSRTEHKSVLDTCKQLEKEGFAVTLVEPDAAGRVPPETVRAALRADTLLVSLMLANNEIGVVSDIAAIAELCRARGVLVHTDASQAVGKLPVDVERLGVDFLVADRAQVLRTEGHRRAVRARERAPQIAPMQFGGGHERGLRSGTLPTHQIVGFGAAAAIAPRRAPPMPRMRAISPRGCGASSNRFPASMFNGAPRASGAGTDQRVLRGRRRREPDHRPCRRSRCPSGSACSSATREPSYVLRSLGRSTELAQSSLRLSLGRFTTAADVDEAATAIRAEVARLRTAGGRRAGRCRGPPGATPRRAA